MRLNTFDNSQVVCEGMYGADSIPWFKKRDSHIVVNVVPYSSSGSIALAVFRFEDRNHFESSPIHANYHICTKAAIQKNHCNATQLGSYILNNFTTSDYVGPFLNTAVHWNYTMNVNFLTAVGKRDNITESNIPVANGSDISAVEQLSEPKNTTTPLNTTKTDNISKAVSETNSTTTSGTNSTISNAANSTQINQQNSSVTTSPELIRQISPLEFYYPVVSNGLYCVLVEVDEFDSEDYADYSVDMNIGSPYGKLPAIFFPALPVSADISYLVFRFSLKCICFNCNWMDVYLFLEQKRIASNSKFNWCHDFVSGCRAVH
ncbi:hypothetical protein HDV02_003340 [Globomyces sp. JEL0801]|nr:hypothetical protein HDV02_003340 [Globomyces sp. JEL0801]